MREVSVKYEMEMCKFKEHVRNHDFLLLRRHNTSGLKAFQNGVNHDLFTSSG